MVRFRGDRLRQCRQAAGLTQRQLAGRAGLRSGDRIRDWGRGVHAPQAPYVPRLAQALGIDALALYDIAPGEMPLAAVRLMRGFSLQRLAAASGLSVMTYQRAEQGLVRPAGDVLARLAAALCVDREQLEPDLAAPSIVGAG